MITRSGRRGAAAHLVKEGIDLYSRHIFVRHYDDVLGEEYAEYLDYRQYEQQLHQVHMGMMNVARGLDEVTGEPVSALQYVTD